MPRLNLSINQEIFDQLQAEANEKGLTVNNMVYSILEQKYSQSGFDYIVALDCLKKEAESMKGEFTLADLPTFKGVEELLLETNSKETPAQVRARLGKMFNDSIKSGAFKDIDRAVIVEEDGSQKAKMLARAAVYASKLSEAMKGE